VGVHGDSLPRYDKKNKSPKRVQNKHHRDPSVEESLEKNNEKKQNKIKQNKNKKQKTNQDLLWHLKSQILDNWFSVSF
jgi:hypothetical protein